MSTGSTLYALHRASGALAGEQKLGGSPSAGCGVGTTHVFVPLTSGKVEAYKLVRKGESDTEATIHHGAGVAYAAPVVTDTRVFWGTAAGDLYADGIEASVARYRFRTNGPIVSQPSFWTPRVYVTSEDGRCYALNEKTGEPEWHYVAGHPIRQPAVPMSDGVYVVSEQGSMAKLSNNNGSMLWAASGISQFVAASAARAYATDYTNRLTVFDAKSGQRLGVLSTS